MGGDGEEELKEALSTLLDQNKAKQYLLQSSDEDKVVVIPFNDRVLDIWQANQLSEYLFTAKSKAIILVAERIFTSGY